MHLSPRGCQVYFAFPSPQVSSPVLLISLVLQLNLESLDALEQADDHFDSLQVDAQVALQAANLPQLCDLFLAIAQFPATLFPLDQAHWTSMSTPAKSQLSPRRCRPSRKRKRAAYMLESQLRQ